MDRFDEVVAPPSPTAESPLKDWRVKYEAGTLQVNDLTNFFTKESRKYFDFKYDYETDADKPSLKCMYQEAAAKEAIIDVLIEFILGDNPNVLIEKLRQEGNTGGVCGKVFKNGEPTYSCRACGMDPTCVLCVNCFKQSAHRYHKYKMSISGGGGCCDCGDEEAWKKDHYCEQHLRCKENPAKSTVVTDAVKERCEVAFTAILSFCVNYLEIEANASMECLYGDDKFCTVLYNDESHTFDQVIQTLTKITKCRHKDAMEIVTSIDREGRAVVRYASFSECAALKEDIEKHHSIIAMHGHGRASQSLRVSVLNIRAVSCQQFALQLLTWFQEFLVKHITFRQIFARLIMDKKARYNIRHILEYDVKLWKTARTCWHRLLISGMLMEYDNKLALAEEFSRHYHTVVQDFIRDDHDHSFSIVSLSVQLFTVPSIAQFLIAKEGIFYKLLHTFYHEAIENYISNKTLRFPKNMTNGNFFKRASYILYDLRYILSFKPDTWTNELREGFIEGCKVLLKLLNVMQGMESVTRQTGQHMDYEPEWECAFNLHIKLANAISLVLEWCGADREVLMKVYQMVMRYMYNNGFIVHAAKQEEKSVAGHTTNCYIYDVSSRPVSIHLPLSRFFAGIYLHLGAYGMSFDNAVIGSKRSPEELMEPILCTQAMIAQVHSNMWRRNGYSLLHQLYFYRNVRCRTEMLDRDIVGMQIGASLLESNQFLIILMNKFNLIDWVHNLYEEKLVTPATDDDFIRQLSMIDEFLEFLIVIIGERWTPGVAQVTEEDRIKKEIIQLLCIKPFSHSELNRSLPDSNNETVLEDVIESVATFKKPQKSDGKGVYELKPELYDQYNMYFYHYTKEEKSKSEETQRLRRKNKGELECCPPPKLPKLTESFVSIANLLQCDVMLTVVSTVLKRALDLKSLSFQENHLQKVLHLIGYGIQEEMSRHYPFLTFCERSKKYQILEQLEQLSHSARVEAHRDFILWTIKQYKEAQSKGSSVPMQSEDSEELPNETNGPMTAAEKEKKEKQERARLAAARRAQIMAQMAKAQRSFMISNAEMFAESNEASDVASSSSTTTMDWQEDSTEVVKTSECIEEEEGAAAYQSEACLGLKRRICIPEEQTYKCILCFEDCTVSMTGPTLVYASFAQKSKVLPVSEPSRAYSVHTSSCGHVMHTTCWKEYFDNEESKEQRRPHRNRLNLISGQPSTEYQCPYCRCLCNTVLPLTPPLAKYVQQSIEHEAETVFPIDQWVDLLKSFAEALNNLRSEMDEELWVANFPRLEAIIERANLAVDVSFFENLAQPESTIILNVNWSNVLQQFRKALQTSYDDETIDPLMLMWQSCGYTVRSLEVFLRAIDKPFNKELPMRHKSFLSGLVRASCLYCSQLNSKNVKLMVKPLTDLLDTLFNHKGHSVLEWHCFNMLMSTILMVPNMLMAGKSMSIIMNNNIMDYYAVQLFFIANMVKAIVLFEADDVEPDTMDIDDEEFNVTQDSMAEVKQLPEKIKENIIAFYRKYNLSARVKAHKAQKAQRLAALEAGKTAEELERLPNVIIECNEQVLAALFEHIKQEMTEFLRCSCLFFHFVADVDFPEVLGTVEGVNYVNMCKYLGLETSIGKYFDNETTYATLLETFASHPDILYYNLDKECKRNGDALKPVPCTRPIPKLKDLPEDYSDLINGVSEFICPNNEREEMKIPTMCLICGETLCGQSYCCQPELHMRLVGACTNHVHYCGADIGVFLRVRDCQIVYLGDSKGCFVHPPYLDEYGETDMGLRRGNPLRLCKERYRKIHLTWLGHGLHEEIARLNDNTNVAVTQWHHM